MDFVIVADKRTGSSFFMECLNSHPELKCYDEMFMIRGGLKKRRNQFLYRHMNNVKNWTIEKYLNFLMNSSKKSVGFRLMYPQNDYFKVLPILLEKNFPIIHLIRKNTFKMVMSKKTKGVFEPQKKIYPPNSIIADIKNHKGKENRYRKALKNYENHIEIYYEDIIGRKEGEKTNVKKFGAFNMKSDQKTFLSENTNEEICDFLQVEKIEMFSNVTKKNSNNVWDYIKNDGKIKKALINNGYGDMIP